MEGISHISYQIFCQILSSSVQEKLENTSKAFYNLSNIWKGGICYQLRILQHRLPSAPVGYSYLSRSPPNRNGPHFFTIFFGVCIPILWFHNTTIWDFKSKEQDSSPIWSPKFQMPEFTTYQFIINRHASWLDKRRGEESPVPAAAAWRPRRAARRGGRRRRRTCSIRSWPRSGTSRPHRARRGSTSTPWRAPRRGAS